MKELWRRSKKQIIILFLVLAIAIPFVIHCAFKIKAIIPFFSAEWLAGDILNYYGDIIGALLAVGGVFFTIQYSQSNYRQDVINRCLPFMTVAKLNYKAKQPSILTEEDPVDAQLQEIERQLGEEYRIEKLYFIVKDKTVKIQEKLSEEQKKLVVSNGLKIEKPVGDGLRMLTTSRLLYLPLEIQNVGVGAATTFSVGLNYKGVPNEKRLFSIATSLKAGDSYHISIYCENRGEENIGDYDLCISYYDILGNAYEQNYIYAITKDELGRLFCSLKIDGTQKRVKGSE